MSPRDAVLLRGTAVPLREIERHHRAVDTYTHGHADSVLQSHRWRTVENSAGYLAPHLRPGLDVLDVGCGPGTITVDLARRVAPGTVLGIDVSADPLDEARALAEREGVAVEFAVGDVYALDAADGSYDVVHAHQVLQHLTDPVAALREMARVCRPGGLIAVRDVDYAATTWFPENPGLDRWLDLYHRVARRNDAEPDAGRRLLSWAHAAGLRDVTATTTSWCFASAAERNWWGTSWAGRATASAFAGQAVGYGLATTEELQAIADAWLAWAAADDGWLGMLHGELLIRA
jgi:2-polyprenyl-3-methyl-5-hydroxy-6-metoxy-1,4-benzoquinol methylase